MRALFTVMVGTGILASPLLAQTPDFSGSWKLNTERSDPPAQTGPGGGGGGMGRADEVYITQSSDKLMLEEKVGEQKRLLTYYLDSRESRNLLMREREIVTKSHWEGAMLVTEGDNTFKTQMGDMRIVSKVVRTLGDDGKTMTVVSTVTSPRGERTTKLVYDKA